MWAANTATERRLDIHLPIDRAREIERDPVNGDSERTGRGVGLAVKLFRWGLKSPCRTGDFSLGIIQMHRHTNQQ